MNNFIFNHSDPEMFCDRTPEEWPHRNFFFDFDACSSASDIFQECKTKPSEICDLPRFVFPECDQKDQLKKEERETQEIKESFISFGLFFPKEESEEIPKKEVNLSISSTKLQNFENQESGCTIKKRWDRTKDKLLFQTIRLLEQENKLSLEEIMAMDAAKDSHTDQGIITLADRIGWTSLRRYLVLRIQSLCKLDFSIRETKKLKKIINKDYGYKDLDYNKIIDEFPGKSLERLQGVSEEIMKRRSMGTLTGFCLKQK